MNNDGVLQHALLLSLLAVAGVVIFLVLHHAGVASIPRLPAVPGVGH